MSLKGFVNFTVKVFKFAVARPIQRFNIYNRSKKYLGPDAKYFNPAPRAIGAMSLSDGKGVKYPHLTQGYKSINQRRLESLEKGGTQLLEPDISNGEQQQLRLPKAYSESTSEDSLVIEASNQLEVTKTVVKIEPPPPAIGEEKTLQLGSSSSTHRPLPKSTNLALQDPVTIWAVEKTPPGRLSLNQLQEIMINKLADGAYWTPKMIADKYNIKEEYAESLLNYMKQIKIVVSPRMKKVLDYVGMNDPYYQSAKHLVYHVDNNLRNDVDKKYDDMFLPGEDLPDEVRQVLERPTTSLDQPNQQKKLVKRPEPLRLSPINKPQLAETSPKHLKGNTSLESPEKISASENRKSS